MYNLGLPFKVTKFAMILSLLLFSISSSSNVGKNDSEKDVSNLLVEMEGIISVLAVDEIDPLTGRRTGKFVNYLQVDTGERYILEPYDKAYCMPLQPNTKVRVLGFKKDKKILYQKIMHINLKNSN